MLVHRLRSFIIINYFRPEDENELVRDFGIEKEIDEFLEESEQNFKKTGFPLCPISVCHLCLPFTPICCMLYCASKREKGLDECVTKFNQAVEGKGNGKGHIYMDLNEDYKLLRTGYYAQGKKKSIL